MNEYPPLHQYKILYARFMKDEGVQRLLSSAGSLDGKKVLDLCAGGLRITKGALKQKASYVSIVEQEAVMFPMTLPDADRTRFYISSVEKFLRSQSGLLCLFPPIFDVVFCQQAINYWLSAECAVQLCGIMKPGAVFLFNTFAQCPPSKPTINGYQYDGRDYMEINWYEQKSNLIHHVQITPELPPHTTSFKWISAEDYTVMLSPYFDLEVTQFDRSVVYKCVKK